MVSLTHEEIDQLAEAMTLEIFNAGSDKTNYKILKMLPTDIKNVMIELNLTRVPVNTRINNLEKAGLVLRRKGTGKIKQTDLTKDFLKLMDTIKIKVDKYIESHLEELN